MASLVETALAEKRVGRLWFRRSLLLANLAPPFLLLQTREPWAWGVTFLLHGLLLHGLLFPNSPLLGNILTRLPTSEKVVWLTIDDGPSADTVPISEMLASHGVQATFFLRGDALEAHPSCLVSLRKHGHSVANHTQNHPLASFWIYLPSQVAREIDAFHSTAQRLSAPLLPAFRCPAGVKNPFLHSILKRRQLTLVGWTLRALDGIRCDPEKNLRYFLPRLSPGAILLVHEGKMDEHGSPASLEFISRLVPAIQERGYRFAS